MRLPRPLTRALLGLAVLLATAAVAPRHAAGAGTPPAVDWGTFGFDLQRSGFNPGESILSPANVAGLHMKWSADLGAVMIAQPVEAAGVRVGGHRWSLVCEGTEHGVLYAIRAATGQVVWHRRMGKTRTSCHDMPDRVFGIGGAAAIDHPNGRLFVAGGSGDVYALDLATGATEPGWPVERVFDPSKDHVYGGLAFDPATGQLYVTTASYCDFNDYHGRVIDIDVTERAIVAKFYPAGQQTVGGGIWGPGGVSIDPDTGHVFAATGNAFAEDSEHHRYAENVVELSPSLQVLGANYPGLTGGDVDFGATPILYQAPGCPPQVAAKNKSGVLVVYTRGNLDAGPTQRLQLADVHDFQFNGIPAYSPVTRTLYVSNSSDSDQGTFFHGLVALEVDPATCQLELKWQRTVGPNPGSVSPPTVAGGMVFYGDGGGDTERAFDATDGTPLWDSGTTITGPLFAAPTAVNGRLFVASWDHRLYAFGP